MKRLSAASFFLVVLLLSLSGSASAQAPVAAPATAQTLTVPGLRDRVTVRRDERGIPYIEAKNDDDLYFAQGYVTASDRLWQMDLLRRTERWSQVSNASMSIGQEIGVTPLQILTAVATVANGGVRVAPHIVDRVVDANHNVIAQTQRPAPVRVISEKTAAVLNEILKSVVARGTGKAAALAEHIVAGKTGTAQKAMRGGYFEHTVKILCVKEEAVLILQLAEKLCPEIISSISRDWSE